MSSSGILAEDTDRKNQYLLRKHLHLLPDFNATNAKIWFIIDGQQRLSVLHQARLGLAQPNGDNSQLDFSRISFRIKDEADNSAPLFSYRKPVAHEYVSVRDIVAGNWRQPFRDLPEYKLARIRECRWRVVDYRLPIIFIETKEIDEVRDLFVRINSLGTPVGSADRVFARAATIDLRSKAREARDSLRLEFRALRYETILQGFALVAEPKLQDVGERAYDAVIRNWERRIASDPKQSQAFSYLWSKYATAFGKAVDYVAEHFRVLNRDEVANASVSSVA